MDQRAAQGGALLHAARELPGEAVAKALEADRVQQLFGAGAVLVLLAAEVGAIGLHDFQRQQDIVDHRAPGQQVGVLERHARQLDRPGDRGAVHDHLAGGRLHQTCDELHQGGFAAARGAHHGDEFALVDVHRAAFECEGAVHAAIAHGHLIDFNKGSGHG